MPVRIRKYSSDTLYPDSELGTTIGDAAALGFGQLGGNDQFFGASFDRPYAAFGDARAMGFTARGGHDVMMGGANVRGTFISRSSADALTDEFSPDLVGSLLLGGIHYAGDAAAMGGTSVGGNDTLEGGLNSWNEYAGDAANSMDGSARGGNDVLVGADATATSFTTDAAGGVGSVGDVAIESSSSGLAVNALYGDAGTMLGGARGGADQVHGGNADATGDGYAVVENFLAGDAYMMRGRATGGIDDLWGGSASASDFADAFVINAMAGDAAFASGGTAVFGADAMHGGDADGGGDGYAIAMNVMAGDLLNFDAAGGYHFGADTMYGGNGAGDGYALNLMVGDMGSGFDLVLPRDAHLDGGAGPDVFDVAALSLGAHAALDETVRHTSTTFAADTLYGGETQALNLMLGDTVELQRGDRGGHDLLVAGGELSQNQMVGDAGIIDSGAAGGNDTLVSGHGMDQMWGDAQQNNGRGGADLFVFGPDNGNDMVMDFEVGIDHIDLTAFAQVDGFPATFRGLVADGRMYEVFDGETVTGVLIELGGREAEGGDSVFLAGINLADLRATDFIL